MSMNLPFSLELLPDPDFAKLTPVQVHQFKPVIGYTDTLDDSLELTKFFAVRDGRDKHVYDLHLFNFEDGDAYLAGTTTHIGRFAEGYPDFDDVPLGMAFERAINDYLIESHRPRAKKPPGSPRKPRATKAEMAEREAKAAAAKRPATKHPTTKHATTKRVPTKATKPKR